MASPFAIGLIKLRRERDGLNLIDKLAPLEAKGADFIVFAGMPGFSDRTAAEALDRVLYLLYKSNINLPYEQTGPFFDKPIPKDVWTSYHRKLGRASVLGIFIREPEPDGAWLAK